jgi:hypothetical protein
VAHIETILVELLLLCVLILASDLATAHGSFRVNTYKVWNNATILNGSTIETAEVGATIYLDGKQILLLAPHSKAKLQNSEIQLETGLARLNRAGPWSISASAVDRSPGEPILAAADVSRLSFAADIPKQIAATRELRPTSQRP